MKQGFWLIGFRGAGKTTIGRAFAQARGWKFLDLDEEWERDAKISIVDFVAKSGLEAFRREELRLLRETGKRFDFADPVVVATGGGVVDWPDSLEFLRQSPAAKVLLEVPPAKLWDRLKKSPDRLKIGDLSSEAALAILLEKRRPFYEKIATYRLENQDISGCIALLENLLEKR